MKVSEIKNLFKNSMPDLTPIQLERVTGICNTIVMNEVSERLTKHHIKIIQDHLEMIGVDIQEGKKNDQFTA